MPNIYITSPLTDDITTESLLSSWYRDNYQKTTVYGDPDTGYKLTESDAEKIKDVQGEYYCKLDSENNKLLVDKTKSITEDSVITSEIADQTWNGGAIEPELTIKDGDDELTKGKDYEVTFTDNTAVGTATVKVTGKNKYTGSFEKKFNIVQGSIADASVTGIASKTYTGKAITQKPVVKLSDNTLTEGTDYTVSYKNNVKVGTATMTITGKGNCAGTITKTFKIKKASNTLSVKAKKTATVKYSKVKKKSQGLKVSSVLSVKNAKGKLSYYKYTSSKTKKISISKSGKITVKKGIKKGTYKVKVKVKAAGDSNYYSKTKTAYFKIKVK